MSRRINLSRKPTLAVGEAVSFPGLDGADAVTSRAFPRKMARPQPESFPRTMPLGQFLFEYLYRRGVRHSFGIPGDFALPTFTWLEKSKIQSITMTHEPAAGFAADAYSCITRSKLSIRSAAFTTKSRLRARSCSMSNAPLLRSFVASRHVCVTNVRFTSKFHTTLLIVKFL